MSSDYNLQGLALIALALLVGCPTSGSGGSCETDRECASDEVCARDGQCTPATDVYPVTLTWTVRGEPATVTTCNAYAASFEVVFKSNDAYADLAFSPVRCALGKFFIDRLPKRYTAASLGASGPTKSITSGSAVFDLK